MIGQLDIPVRQVEIEARIVNANTNFSEELGIRFGGAMLSVDGSRYLKLGGSLRTLSDLHNGIDRDGVTGIRRPDDLVVDLGVDGDGTSSIAVGVTDATHLLDLELSALAQDGRAEIVAVPRSSPPTNVPRPSSPGSRFRTSRPPVPARPPSPSRTAVLQLEVTPQITPDERIVMDLAVKQDTVGRIYHGVPR